MDHSLILDSSLTHPGLYLSTLNILFWALKSRTGQITSFKDLDLYNSLYNMMNVIEFVNWLSLQYKCCTRFEAFYNDISTVAKDAGAYMSSGSAGSDSTGGSSELYLHRAQLYSSIQGS
jgi:hypothetical protein